MAASVPITTVTLGSDAELAPRIIDGLNSGASNLSAALFVEPTTSR
jgi:hypothetical protein